MADELGLDAMLLEELDGLSVVARRDLDLIAALAHEGDQRPKHQHMSRRRDVHPDPHGLRRPRLLPGKAGLRRELSPLAARYCARRRWPWRPALSCAPLARFARQRTPGGGSEWRGRRRRGGERRAR